MIAGHEWCAHLEMLNRPLPNWISMTYLPSGAIHSQGVPDPYLCNLVKYEFIIFKIY